MKTLLRLLLPAGLLILFISLQTVAQFPQAFSYQAVIRDNAGEIISDSDVIIRFSLTDGQGKGNVLFSETHSTETNQFGIVSLAIGRGTVVEGDFAEIDWASAFVYLHVELNLNDGNGYTDMGSSPMLAVPYALHAASGTEGPSGPQGDPGPAGPPGPEGPPADLPDDVVTGTGTPGNLAFWEDVSSLGYIPYIFYGDDESVQISSRDDAGDDDPIFEVKNRDGQVVFGVYQTGVRIYVDEESPVKGIRAGFAVGGFSSSKSVQPLEFLRVDPGFVRININDSVPGDDENGSKGTRAGFAVGGFTNSKQSEIDYFSLTPASALFSLDETDLSKGTRAGFAVGGFTSSKEGLSEYLNITGSAEAEIIDPSQPRILWYPQKEAFMAGRVLVEHPDSVGTNSWASGFESKAIGDYSQALGYKAIARGDYSTAIGKNSIAQGNTSFAFGDSALALVDYSFALGNRSSAIGINSFSFGEKSLAEGLDSYSFGRGAIAKTDESYAFGRGAIAEGFRSFAFGSAGVDSLGQITGVAYAKGDYSFVLGQGSVAEGFGAIAIGIADTARGPYSIALGYGTKAGGWYSTAMGINTIAGVYGSTALGVETNANGSASTAIGWLTLASGNNSTAMGYKTISSHESTTTMGRWTEASYYAATAMGEGTLASGWASTAMGKHSQATGEASTAMGQSSVASGYYSTAMGREVVASNWYSVAMGNFTIASGNSATAMGEGTIASGLASLASGSNTIASGSISTAMGLGNKAPSAFETVIGCYNKVYVPNDSLNWHEEDRLFTIGNGTVNHQSNALTILKSGKTAINHDNPTEMLDVEGNARFRDVTYIGSGDALNIDGNGVLFRSVSDQRLKTNIKPYTNALANILSLRGVYFNWLGDGTERTKIGFIAQEVEEVLPELVFTNSTDGLKSVNYAEMTAVLVEAMKEQNDHIQVLQKENELLREQIDQIIMMISTAKAE